jgi:hypothetical protein
MHKKGLRDSVQAQDVILREGWLEKQSSGTFKQWQKRYFRLSGHYLTYYADEKTDEVKGACDLNTVTLCVHEELSIRVIAPGQELLLRAALAEDAEKWQTSLLMVCGAQQQLTPAQFTNSGQQQGLAAPGLLCNGESSEPPLTASKFASMMPAAEAETKAAVDHAAENEKAAEKVDSKVAELVLLSPPAEVDALKKAREALASTLTRSAHEADLEAGTAQSTGDQKLNVHPNR